MDYLDPQKQFRHRIILFTGYLLMAVAIVVSAVVLLNQAYGYGLDKHGNLIQTGLVYISSQPNPAKITLNGKSKGQTNKRLELPEDIYHVSLDRDGYRSWQRTIEVYGNTVQHFDYPFLFPQKLVTAKAPLKAYDAQPSLATQSPDHRWLLVQPTATLTDLEMYDLSDTTKPGVALSLPSALFTAGSNERVELVQWADDNQHVLLQHFYDDKSEYILVDRSSPSQSVNLNTTLNISPTKLELLNLKYDRYSAYDATSHLLQTLTLRDATPTVLASHVLAYQTYGDNTVLYVTDTGAASGKVNLQLQVGTKNYTIRTFNKDGNYLLDLTEYNGTLTVAAGNAIENKIYIYRDPIAQLTDQSGDGIGPAQVLHLAEPTYLSFSPNAQFIVAEGAREFGVYDNQNSRGYNYTAPLSLDAPQVHAAWMDGDRLTYVSGGKLIVFDYDHTNQQTLMPADASFLPFFTPNYKSVMTLAPGGSTAETNLTQTSLLVTP